MVRRQFCFVGRFYHISISHYMLHQIHPIDMCKVLSLHRSVQGPVHRTLHTLTTLVCSVAKERFGFEEAKKRKEASKPNRRQHRIENLRKEIRQLKKQYRDSSPMQRLGLSQLRDTLRTKLKSLRRAENTKRKARERTRKRAAFTANASLPRLCLTRSVQEN